MVRMRMSRLMALAAGIDLAQGSPIPPPGGNANPNGSLIGTGQMSLGTVEEMNESTVSNKNPPALDASSTTNDKSGDESLVIGPKKRKTRPRNHSENQETGLAKVIYYKKMKWKAAIRVGKKQFQLGTVDSRKEADHLYDRAVFVFGKDPNSKLSEEEKQELSKYTWKDFLAMTRTIIADQKFMSETIGGMLIRSTKSSLHHNNRGRNNAVSPAAAEEEGTVNSVACPLVAEEEVADNGNSVDAPAAEE